MEENNKAIKRQISYLRTFLSLIVSIAECVDPLFSRHN